VLLRKIPGEVKFDRLSVWQPHVQVLDATQVYDDSGVGELWAFVSQVE
jgi:hypothetical protein